MSLKISERSLKITPASLKISTHKPSQITPQPPVVRFSTLEAICKALDCQPGGILEYREEE